MGKIVEIHSCIGVCPYYEDIREDDHRYPDQCNYKHRSILWEDTEDEFPEWCPLEESKE
jgi:hypothetical protein